MAWILLIIAGLLEVFGVAMMNRWQQSKQWTSILALIIGFGSSLALLSYAMETIPMGTAYAIWTGIGAAGGALIGMIFFKESKDWRRILFIILILASAIGLKLFS